MSSSLDAYLRRLRDPRWIPHISDYCDVRCHRCAFTERCWFYALRNHEDAASPELDPEPEPETESEPPTRHGIDFDDFTMNAAETKAYEELEERIKNDPLGKRAEEYGMDVWKLLQPLVPEERGDGFGRAAPGSELSNAIEDVWGLALTIGAKTHRAISSLEYNKEEDFEADPVQTDANGSAKVAWLAIAQSLSAWKIVRSAELLDPGLVDYVVGSLKQIESDLQDRF